MSKMLASQVTLLEVRLEVLDQVRDWLRRSMLAVFGLWVLTSIVRELRFDEGHRLPLAIMLVLLGAALLGITLRVVLALARSALARELQALRLESLVQEARQ